MPRKIGEVVTRLGLISITTAAELAQALRAGGLNARLAAGGHLAFSEETLALFARLLDPLLKGG